MDFDEYGNPIIDPEKTGQQESEIVDNANATDDQQENKEETIAGHLTSETMVDSLIADLLTDDEKGSLRKEEGQPIIADPEKKEEVTPDPDKKKAISPDNHETYLVDGKEITWEALKAGHLRQADYTRKTQELAEEKARIAKYEVLNRHLEQNPEAMQKVIDALKGQQGEQPKSEVPEDPIDAITHNATQAAIKQTEQIVGGVKQDIQNLSLLQKQESVKMLVAQDPLAQSTRNSMAAFVYGEYQNLNGKAEADRFMAGLDNDPELFAKYYAHHRKKVEQTLSSQDPGPNEQKGSGNVVSREKKVPFVAGSETQNPPIPTETKKRRELKHLHKKTRGGTVEDVVRFLEVSGMVDHLS